MAKPPAGSSLLFGALADSARIKQRQNAEEQLLKQMEERTAEMRFNNTVRRVGGNEHAARRAIAAEDEQNAAVAERGC